MYENEATCDDVMKSNEEVLLQVDNLHKKVNEFKMQVDKRFEQMDIRMGRMDERLGRIESVIWLIASSVGVEADISSNGITRVKSKEFGIEMVY